MIEIYQIVVPAVENGSTRWRKSPKWEECYNFGQPDREALL